MKKSKNLSLQKFIGKHVCPSLFFDENYGSRSATLVKRSYEKNIFPWTTFYRTPVKGCSCVELKWNCLHEHYSSQSKKHFCGNIQFWMFAFVASGKYDFWTNFLLLKNFEWILYYFLKLWSAVITSRKINIRPNYEITLRETYIPPSNSCKGQSHITVRFYNEILIAILLY